MSIINVDQKYVNGNLVFHKADNPDIWYDAIGPTVHKYYEDFNGPTVTGADNADPVGWTVTAIAGDAGAGTITVANEAGGAVIITPDATENDGIEIQFNNEAWTLTAGDPLSFHARLKVLDADQMDVLVGLCITDTTLMAGLSDGVYFLSADESAVIGGVCELDSAASTSASTATLTDVTYSELDFYYDGAGSVRFYVDGVLVDTVTETSATNICTDEALTFSIGTLTGEGTANTVTLDQIRIIQCQ